ncbi:MAG: zinc ABC transporter substrate-binding protein [Clostridia bacterium]|nr:zinc ABC transporter substrate-binding protein [Clostridia bacterium]
MKKQNRKNNFTVRRAAVLVLALLLLCLPVFGCTKKGEKDSRMKIVCSVFPIWDWTGQVLGSDRDDVELTLLVRNGTDLHSFQPSVADIAAISSCDLFLYVGGESDDWVRTVLEQNGKDVLAVPLLEVLGDRALAEETLPGEEEEEEEAADEHIWLSFENASFLTGVICEKLSALNPDKAGLYRENKDAYLDRIDALYARFRDAVARAKFDTLLFGDRFPFLYLVRELGLKYDAAFSGCSAETEASFATIRRLASRADELGLPAVLRIDGSPLRIAETVAENTKAKNMKILMMDSMQSVTDEQIRSGTSYLSVMEYNLGVLQKALGREE